MIFHDNLIVIFALLAPSTGLAFDLPVESKIPVYCNAQSGAIFLSAVPDDLPKIQSNFQKHTINWVRLLQVGPQKNASGDPLRTGSKFKTLHCGSITIKYSSGFLNASPTGELGSLDFPVIEVLKGRQVLLKSTALETCDVNIHRYQYFGICPNRWARSIEIKPTSKGLTLEVKRTFIDEGLNEIERTDVY